MNLDCTTAKMEQKVEYHQSCDNLNEINSSGNTSNFPIRVCSDCNTTKTPLWRSGPKGPKVTLILYLSLLNSILELKYLLIWFFHEL